MKTYEIQCKPMKEVYKDFYKANSEEEAIEMWKIDAVKYRIPVKSFLSIKEIRSLNANNP